jgi:uncharacterized membrane protein
MKVLLALFFIFLPFPLVTAFNLSINAHISSTILQTKEGNIEYVIENVGDEVAYNLSLLLKTSSQVYSKASTREIDTLYPKEKKSILFPINIEGREGSYGLIVFCQFFDRFGSSYNLVSPGLVSFKNFNSLEGEIGAKIDKTNFLIGESKNLNIFIKNFKNDHKILSLEFFTPPEFEILGEKYKSISLGPSEEKKVNFNIKAIRGSVKSNYSVVLALSDENDFHRSLVIYDGILIEGVKSSSEISFWIFLLPLFGLILIFYVERKGKKWNFLKS